MWEQAQYIINAMPNRSDDQGFKKSAAQSLAK
jgi:hypothetical protein